MATLACLKRRNQDLNEDDNGVGFDFSRFEREPNPSKFGVEDNFPA